jgi:hypothetical protein
MEENSPNPESERRDGLPPPAPPPPPAVHPQTLDYVRPHWREGYQPRTPVGVQFLIGMLSPYIGTFGSAAMVAKLIRGSEYALWAGALGLVMVFVLGGIARVRYGWRGYLPGVLTGIGLGLLAVGICFAIVCGGIS